MKTDILPVPKLQDEILNAINDEKLVVFIGAGVSRLIGCYGWDKLAENLVNKCYSESYIDYKEKESLNNDISDHRKKITICYHIFEKHNKLELFFLEMSNALKEGEELEKPNIYDEIYKLRGIFITTNADRHFDHLFLPENIYYHQVDFFKDRLAKNKLFHIHGSIIEKESIIFTLQAYFDLYGKPPFIEFLNEVFDNYNILFIGYGLAEFELLEFLFNKTNKKAPKEIKHFMLMPFYKGEDNILEFEQSYYSDMGIKVIPYAKDEKGYDQLKYIIKEWNTQISQKSLFLYSSYQRIDKFIEKNER